MFVPFKENIWSIINAENVELIKNGVKKIKYSSVKKDSILLMESAKPAKLENILMELLAHANSDSTETA